MWFFNKHFQRHIVKPLFSDTNYNFAILFDKIYSSDQTMTIFKSAANINSIKLFLELINYGNLENCDNIRREDQQNLRIW